MVKKAASKVPEKVQKQRDRIAATEGAKREAEVQFAKHKVDLEGKAFANAAKYNAEYAETEANNIKFRQQAKA
jgi:large subunit ribosomal protein L7e